MKAGDSFRECGQSCLDRVRQDVRIRSMASLNMKLKLEERLAFSLIRSNFIIMPRFEFPLGRNLLRIH